MPTESLYPDGETGTTTNFTGDYTNVDDPQATPGSDWMDPTDDALDNRVSFSMTTPTGDLTIGADLQTIKVHVRKQLTGGGNPSFDLGIWEAGNLRVVLVTDHGITSETGEDFTYTWDASVLSDVSGVDVEILFYGYKSGGGPSNRRNLSIGAVEWVADYTISAPNVNGTVSVTSSSAASASGLKNGLNTVSVSAGNSCTASGEKQALNSVTASASNSVTTNGLKATNSNVSISTSSSVTATGIVAGENINGTVSVTTSTGIVATGFKTSLNGALVTSTTGVHSSGLKEAKGTPGLSANTSVISIGTKHASQSVSITSASSTDTIGLKATSGVSSIGTTTAVTAQGTPTPEETPVYTELHCSAVTTVFGL